MAGTVIPVFGKSSFDFGGLQQSTSEEIVYLKTLDVPNYVSGMLIVRVHSSNIDSGGKIEVLVFDTVPTPEEPHTDFLASTAGATATVDDTTTSKIVTATLAEGFGPAIRVVVRGTRGTNTNVTADLSVDLVLREPAADGVTIPLWTRREFDFSGLASSSTEDRVLVKALDVSPYLRGELVVRVHSADIGSDRELDILTETTAPSPEEPATDFTGDAPIAAAQIDGTTAPTLVHTTPLEDLGSHVRILARGTNGSSPAGNFTATLSADLVAKSPRATEVVTPDASVSVQRGVLDFGASEDSTTVTITAVSSTDRAFARITGVRRTSGGPAAGTTSDKDNDDLGVTCVLTDTTTITFTRESGGLDSDYRVYWEVLESPTSGGNQFFVRFQDNVTVNSSTLEVDTAVSGVSNLADCVPFIAGVRSDYSNHNLGRMSFTAKMVDASGDKVRVNREFATSNNCLVSVAVVEFTGSNWTVQNNVEHNYSAGGSNETETITDVSDTTTAFVVIQHRFGGQNNDDTGYNCWFKDSNELYFRLRSTVSNPWDHYTVAHVVTSASLTVQHLDSVLGGETDHPSGSSSPQTVNTTVNAVASLAAASAFATADDSDTSPNYPRPHWLYRLTSTTNVEWWRGRHGSSADWTLQVVQW